jgi:hypothetical protein
MAAVDAFPAAGGQVALTVGSATTGIKQLRG